MQVIDIKQDSELIGLAPVTIRRHLTGAKMSPALESFPAPIRRGRGYTLQWLDVDVLAWLEAQRTFRPEATTTHRCGPGRPRKGAV